MGLGYIGLPTAVIAAKEGGVDVVGVDINPSVVEQTNAGHLHIVEPGMETMLQEVVSAGKLHASSTPEVADAYFMVVPTPFKGNHEPDVSYVEAATRAVLPLFKEGDLYVITNRILCVQNLCWRIIISCRNDDTKALRKRKAKIRQICSFGRTK